MGYSAQLLFLPACVYMLQLAPSFLSACLCVHAYGRSTMSASLPVCLPACVCMCQSDPPPVCTFVCPHLRTREPLIIIKWNVVLMNLLCSFPIHEILVKMRLHEQILNALPRASRMLIACNCLNVWDCKNVSYKLGRTKLGSSMVINTVCPNITVFDKLTERERV
jgi:hypothetical protein